MRRLYKSLIAFLCVTFMALTMPIGVWATDNADEDVRTIKVGYCKMDGFHELSSDGKFSGYGYDFYLTLSRYSPLNFEYVGYDLGWSDMLDMLERGEIDVIATAMSVDQGESSKYDFSENIGSSSTVIKVMADSELSPDGFENYNLKSFGVVKGTPQVSMFKAYASENGFLYYEHLFRDYSSLNRALAAGQIDAAVTTSMQKTSDTKVLGTIDSEKYYVMVKKGNTELLDEINSGIAQMDLYEGDWRNTLYYKYYGPELTEGMQFTQAEKQLIKEFAYGGRVLKVAVNPNHEPYSYVENGQVKGIIPDIFEKAISETGMKYEYIVFDSEDEYLKAYNDKTIDIMLDSVSDATTQEKIGYIVTEPYLTLTMSKIMRKDMTQAVKTVGLAKRLKNPGSVYSGNATIVTYDSFRDLYDAVMAGKIDAAYLHSYCAELYINKDPSSLIANYNMPTPTYAFKVAVNNQIPHEICSILNKLYQPINQNEKYDIVSNYIEYSAKNAGIYDWLLMHPAVFATGVIGLSVILAAFVVLSSITRRERRFNEELKVVSDAAREANEAKTSFLFNMSHDIRTPMNAILGFAKIAREHTDDKVRLGDSLDKIETSGEQLLNLINDILEMSRIESGRLDIVSTPSDILRCGDGINPMLESLAINKNIEYTMTFGEIKDRYVRADISHVNRVLVNIITNAIKYTESEGRVSVHIIQNSNNKDGKAVYRFIVSDTGIGMSEEFIAHMYENFARERSATVSRQQGTGLGLSIAKRIVEALDGRIDVVSRLGEGSTFTIDIPFEIMTNEEIKAYLTEIDEEAENDEDDNVKRFAGKKVLLVEDNELNREIATDILSKVGFVIDEAEDGSVAVDTVREKGASYYDFILMDIQMPIMDGYEATQQIRQMHGQGEYVPIIALSANAFDEDIERSFKAGMNAHIAKPINTKELFATLTKLA